MDGAMILRWSVAPCGSLIDVALLPSPWLGLNSDPLVCVIPPFSERICA